MVKFFVAMICLISSSAFAIENAFDLKMDLSIDGKHVSSPQIVVKDGEKGLIVQEIEGQQSFIEVIAKEGKAPNGKQAIAMNFIVGKISSDGTRTIISRPRIISSPNEKAQISIGDKDHPDALSLTVIANKATL